MIKLNQLIKIDNPSEYKMHVAKNNQIEKPLDVFTEDFEKWIGWNEWRGEGNKNRFTRRYVISFIDFYPQPGNFLFGGIFEILETHSDHYDVKLLDDYREYIGRLKVTNVKTTRGSAFHFEKHYDLLEVVELLDKTYSTQAFPGYENINYSFLDMKNIIDKNALDWKSPLENISGIYMLTDTKTNKRYIGSAYGDDGIWARWKTYCENGHCGNKLLKKLHNEQGFDYIKNNFKFTLLESYPRHSKEDSFIIGRESYWKYVLLTRIESFGYNDN